MRTALEIGLTLLALLIMGVVAIVILKNVNLSTSSSGATKDGRTKGDGKGGGGTKAGSGASSGGGGSRGADAPRHRDTSARRESSSDEPDRVAETNGWDALIELALSGSQTHNAWAFLTEAVN